RQPVALATRPMPELPARVAVRPITLPGRRCRGDSTPARGGSLLRPVVVAGCAVRPEHRRPRLARLRIPATAAHRHTPRPIGTQPGRLPPSAAPHPRREQSRQVTDGLHSMEGAKVQAHPTRRGLPYTPPRPQRPTTVTTVPDSARRAGARSPS